MVRKSYTPEQITKNIKDAPQRIEDGIKSFEAMGGKVIGFYTVMGEYDYVSIGEALNDEIVMTFMLALGSSGNVRMRSDVNSGHQTFHAASSPA